MESATDLDKTFLSYIVEPCCFKWSVTQSVSK